ncbi:integral membrane protein [Phlyctema vagabunda]|uniref:Integral membrane protein n=1 Tax=Phlyctema vagabunda TaxID=108571 RepID=A0ABR4PTX8_9HELO
MGWTFNTVNPDADTNAPTITAVGVSFSVLSLIFVCLRMYVRGFMIKAIGLDDWTIVVTWFLALGFMVVTILQSKYGLGLQNLSDMPDQNIYMFGLYQYCGAPFYILSILGFKLSLLFSFLRIAVERVHRMAIMVIIGLCTAHSFCFLIVQINLCSPISKQWDPAVTTGSCLVAVPFYTSMASLTILFDVVIMLTPFPMLLKAQIQPKKKIVLLGIFSLGTFVTVIQIIRILTIKSLANYIDSSQLIMWSMVENNLGIIVASIPPLSPLIRSFREHTSSGRSKGKSSRGLSYGLQSMKPGANGHVVLGSGNDMRSGAHDGMPDYKENSTVVVAAADPDNSSEEFIFPNSNHHHHQRQNQIYQKTEITVSREANR